MANLYRDVDFVVHRAARIPALRGLAYLALAALAGFGLPLLAG